MEKIYRNCINQIESTESFIGRVIQVNNDVNILYFNLGIFKCPILNEDDQIKFIDMSILTFRNVVSMKEDYDANISVNGTELQIHYFAGFDIAAKIYREFQIICEDVELKVLEDSKISIKMWSPFNMRKDVVKTFLETNTF